MSKKPCEACLIEMQGGRTTLVHTCEQHKGTHPFWQHNPLADIERSGKKCIARCSVSLKGYALYLGLCQEKAREMGYNLVLHGSQARDCDWIAIPWVDNPQPHFELIKALDFLITGRTEYTDPSNYLYSILPGGRHSYVINVYRGGYTPDREEYIQDPQYYIDISVTPLPV